MIILANSSDFLLRQLKAFLTLCGYYQQIIDMKNEHYYSQSNSAVNISGGIIWSNIQYSWFNRLNWSLKVKDKLIALQHTRDLLMKRGQQVVYTSHYPAIDFVNKYSNNIHDIQYISVQDCTACKCLLQTP